MPGCYRASKHDAADTKQEDWEEPPGYLGEAVRRTKQIARQKLIRVPPDERDGE